MLEPSSRSVRLLKLQPNTRYKVCVLGLGNWLTARTTSDGSSRPSELSHSRQRQQSYHQPQKQQAPRFNGSHNDVVLLEKTALPAMADSATSRCTEALTLELPDAVASSDGSTLNSSDEATDNSAGSVLTRRLGLIIGCCMGFVVFILLVSVLGYLKVVPMDIRMYFVTRHLPIDFSDDRFEMY